MTLTFASWNQVASWLRRIDALGSAADCVSSRNATGVYVPMTKRLTDALGDARHLHGSRVLCNSDGKPLTQKIVQVMLRRAARRANVKGGGGWRNSGGGGKIG